MATFSNGSVSYLSNNMDVSISGATIIDKKEYELSQEDFDKLMNEPSKWEIVKSEDGIHYELKEKA